MSEPFVGEIRMFAGNFAPRGWAGCEGQLLAVSQNDALFSLLGTQYGGDGETTFGLPDLRGRIPIHQGSGPGLSPRNIGSRGGQEWVTLTSVQVPAHNHNFRAVSGQATENSPGSDLTLAQSVGFPLYTPPQNLVAMPISAISITGSSLPQPHANLMPYLCINFIIALIGVFPSQS